MTAFKAVIDPNWDADQGGGGRGANEHYELADVSTIAEGYYKARDNDGKRIWPALNTREPMLVFMWATVGAMAQRDEVDMRQTSLIDDPDLSKPPDAYVLARLLGLRVCAQMIWAKVDKHVSINGDVSWKPPLRYGIGQWTRCEHETLLICRRGHVSVPAPAMRPRSMIYASRGTHSSKPEAAWKSIEIICQNAMPDVVGIEFNCRRRREGWAAFGALDGESKPLRYEAPADGEVRHGA